MRTMAARRAAAEPSASVAAPLAICCYAVYTLMRVKTRIKMHHREPEDDDL